MAEERRIRKVVKSRSTVEGAGVHLRRAIGFGPPELYDPFLLLDDFRSDEPEHYRKGFPWHPHRGMETITYVLRGEVEHGDSLGNRGVISPGDVQWMTAGSGIIHQEMPKGDPSGAMYGFQLWANLPAADKMMAPRYRGISAAQIPEVKDGSGATIKVIAGAVNRITGPVTDVVTQPEYLDVTVPPGVTFSRETPRGHTVFAYVFGGEAMFGPQRDPYSYEAEGAGYFDLKRDALIDDGHLVLFGDGDAVAVTTEAQPVRFLLVSGKPIGEPVAWYGPIVMNTQEELRTAFEELEAGTFIKAGRR
ncbi:pirin family protein [Anaeromyxobacter sp. SG26]|uniref:pirin family protein n=1 Tax=Anaeromyxobacter sp. SG26 TaxID=2925407 RepID=UPI001F573227|nr:pirin family protein [Anaeromyxobacter sp. SG26]